MNIPRDWIRKGRAWLVRTHAHGRRGFARILSFKPRPSGATSFGTASALTHNVTFLPTAIRFSPQICGDSGRLLSSDIIDGPAPWDAAPPPAPASDRLIRDLRAALATLRVADQQGIEPGGLTLRAGSLALGDPALADLALWAIDAADIPPARVTLAVGGMAFHDAQSVETLARLRRVGCLVELCDFGTHGEFLLPQNRTDTPQGFDVVRLSRDFTHNCGMNRQRQHIVLAMLALAEQLGVTTHADNISRKADLSFLVQIGVGRVSGPAVSLPLDAARFESFARQRRDSIDAMASLRLA